MVKFDTTFLDYPSTDDMAIIIFMSGCSHNCLGCHNIALRTLHEPFTDEYCEEVCNQLREQCSRNDTNKIVLSGGDCLNPCNRKLTDKILSEFGSDYDICIYTGYSIDQVKEFGITGFKYIKCGKFDINNIQEVEKTDEYIQFVNPTQNLFDSTFTQLSKNGRFYFNKQSN